MRVEGVAAAALVGGILMLGAGVAGAGQMAVLVADKDATIIEDPPTNASGAWASLAIGTLGVGAGNIEDRVLISFDIAGSSIPSGATITGATLTLFLADRARAEPPAANTIDVHLLLKAWGEGASSGISGAGLGSPAMAGDSTWTSRIHPGQPWAALGLLAGTDYVAGSSATQSVDAESMLIDLSWSSSQLAADVEFWLDNPGSNFGWFMIGSSVNASAKRFSSREDLTLGLRPELAVTYTVPEPAPILAGITAIAALAALRAPRRAMRR